MIQITNLIKDLNFKLQLQIELPSLIIAGIVGIVFAFKDYGVWSLVYMDIIRGILLNIQYWLRVKWRPSFIFNQKKFSDHFHFGYKLTLSGLLNTILSNIFPIIIGKFYSGQQVGFYTRAQTMKDFPVKSLSGALNKVTYPLFAATKSDRQLKSAMKRVQSLVLFVLAPVMLLSIIIAKPLFLFLLGKQWLPAVPYFQLLCITGIFYPIHNYNLNVLKVKGKSDQFLFATIIKKSTLIIGILLTMKIGIIALILSLVANNIISLGVNMYFGSKHIDYSIKEQCIDIGKVLMPSISIFILVYLIAQLKIFDYLHPTIYVSIIVVIFITLYYLFCSLLKMEVYQDASNLIKNDLVKKIVYKYQNSIRKKQNRKRN